MRLLFLFPLVLLAAEDGPRIMKPVDHSALKEVEILASGSDAFLEVDGKRIEAQQPFPGVLQARPQLGNGEHAVALVWSGGRKEIQIFVGSNAPAGYQVFREHPPGLGAACKQCHEVTKRNRFYFKGGCFDCHQKDSFAKAHTHTPDVLTECGLCHNAHGSTVKSHLIMAKETACKQCHN